MSALDSRPEAVRLGLLPWGRPVCRREERRGRHHVGRSLGLRPNWLPAELKLAQALIDLGQSEAAVKLLAEVRSRHPADATVSFLYGRATGEPAHYERAVAAFPQYGALFWRSIISGAGEATRQQGCSRNMSDSRRPRRGG